MKIVIAKSLVQSVLGTSAGLAGQFAILTREVEEELGVKAKSSTGILNKIPHFNDIKASIGKIVSVHKTTDEVTIEINDEFIEDVAELSAKMIRKTMPLSLQYIKVAVGLQKDLDSLESKWKPESNNAEDTSAT